MKTKIEKFTQLTSWQKAHELVLVIYKITKNFPIDERFALVQQMRRCAVSITSNIAEGFVRMSYVEKIRFYKNEANTTPYEGIYTMTNKTKISNGAEIIGFYDKPTFGSFDDMKNPLIFDCANNFLKTRPFGFKLYNKNLINDLKQEYCTSGGGGKSVGNIGRYSQIDNKKPSNIA